MRVGYVCEGRSLAQGVQRKIVGEIKNGNNQWVHKEPENTMVRTSDVLMKFVGYNKCQNSIFLWELIGVGEIRRRKHSLLENNKIHKKCMFF